MTFDDLDLMDMHEDLFEEFGIDGTAQRGDDAAVAVRLVIDRGAERVGE